MQNNPGPTTVSPFKIAPKFLKNSLEIFRKRKRRVKRALSAFMGAKMDEPKRKLRDAHVEAQTEDGYRRRMLDTVLGPDHPLKLPDMTEQTITNELKHLLPNEFKDLMDIVKKIPGIDDKGRDRFLSPRFMPLFPNSDSGQNNSLLSPEVMPMYRLPSLLNATGLMEREREGLLSLIIESSGAMDVVDEAMEAITKTRDLGLGKDITEVTKMITATFNEVKGMFSPQQHEEMEDRDFTFATTAQLKKLYGSQGMYNASQFPMDLDEYDKWSDDEKEQSLRNTIRILADRGEEDHPAAHGRRYKRALGVDDIVFPDGFTIKFFAHTTLSPLAFSPTFKTLSVLGPTVLSPTMFCPSFVSALLLSPPIIAPELADPIFLSPYVLGPNVMSAAMFNVYVLSPYVMSPNVINPYVMSPLILSPFVLCPDVLSPEVLCGAILSPSVMSPMMYSKQAMSVSILSPSWLS
ncbi:hypothetical protein PENTCL1PPCAC_1946 [Pristionchus entomophagus]|uniref:Uncharacterized protein n=1 Tax=Pristionchus entomophagus TaxID=358040 RepID=A0AAV5SBD8_9BILA|nr:hypothetical protein PENTCL1PPCAC_1946 [Pristionchus entomophagus]